MFRGTVVNWPRNGNHCSIAYISISIQIYKTLSNLHAAQKRGTSFAVCHYALPTRFKKKTFLKKGSGRKNHARKLKIVSAFISCKNSRTVILQLFNLFFVFFYKSNFQDPAISVLSFQTAFWFNFIKYTYKCRRSSI